MIRRSPRRGNAPARLTQFCTRLNYLGSIIPYTKNRSIFVCPTGLPATAVPSYKWALCTELSCSTMHGNAVVMGRSLSEIPAPADIIYLDENRFRFKVAWLRPQLV